MEQSRLFKPLQIGSFKLQHRVGLPGVTRRRATDDHVPSALMKEYYSARAIIPGTLLITEANLVSPMLSGIANAPGIWNEEQVAAWKTITDEVHSRDGIIICQLDPIGRVADPELAEREGFDIIAPSAIPYEEGAPVPRAMTIDEIKQAVRECVTAAENAIRAGFDAVEVYGGNGQLIDQFLQDVSNKRDDEYGGSVENRSRFAYEILEAVAGAIGPKRLGFRLSPWSTFQGMRMREPIPQFSDIIAKTQKLGLAYLSLIESRVAGGEDVDGAEDKLDFALSIWKGPVFFAGGYKPDRAKQLVEEHPDRDIVVLFGRYFTSNPDLVFRIKKGVELTHYDRSAFYLQRSPKGYLGFPYSREYLESEEAFHYYHDSRRGGHA